MDRLPAFFVAAGLPFAAALLAALGVLVLALVLAFALVLTLAFALSFGFTAGFFRSLGCRPFSANSAFTFLMVALRSCVCFFSSLVFSAASVLPSDAISFSRSSIGSLRASAQHHHQLCWWPVPPQPGRGVLAGRLVDSVIFAYDVSPSQRKEREVRRRGGALTVRLWQAAQ